MKNVRVTRRNGLGDVVAHAIHSAVDAAPLAPETKARIKNCAGCKKRRSFLNKAGYAVGKFIAYTRKLL